MSVLGSAAPRGAASRQALWPCGTKRVFAAVSLCAHPLSGVFPLFSPPLSSQIAGRRAASAAARQVARFDLAFFGALGLAGLASFAARLGPARGRLHAPPRPWGKLFGALVAWACTSHSAAAVHEASCFVPTRLPIGSGAVPHRRSPLTSAACCQLHPAPRQFSFTLAALAFGLVR